MHILNVHEVWIGYVLQGRSSDQELEKLFGDSTRKPGNWREFNAYNRRVWALIEAYMGRLTAGMMSRPVHAFWMPGEYNVADGLMQTTFEEAHHLGEIIGAFWQQNTEPPHMTWIEIGRTISRR